MSKKRVNILTESALKMKGCPSTTSSIYSAPALHNCDFQLDSLQLGLCNVVAKQVLTDQTAFCAPRSLHCCSCTLPILCAQRRIPAPSL